jgi:uncharacterized protein (DUF488 family)
MDRGKAQNPGNKTTKITGRLVLIITIGVYGFSEEGFFQKLQQVGVTTFCDIRWRRGVRGREYAFANSARLQKRLAELGIRYLHFRELAPSPELRKRQAAADQAAGIAKRKRAALGEAFIAGYREALAGFNSRRFIESLGVETKIAALFCVERNPEACHRSLLVERLAEDLGPEIEATHLLPDS